MGLYFQSQSQRPYRGLFPHQSKSEDRGIFLALEQEGRKEEGKKKDGSCDTSYIDGVGASGARCLGKQVWRRIPIRGRGSFTLT